MHPPFIKNLTLENLLSFGKRSSVALKNLNVIIGPNGSGKSNLLEAISLIAASHGDMVDVVRDGGGIGDWLWKGKNSPTANIEVVVANPNSFHGKDIRHSISFKEVGQRFEIVDEFIEEDSPRSDDEERPYFFYQFQNNRPVLNVNSDRRELKREDVSPEKSIIAQRKDPDQYPEITYLGNTYEKFKIYREWSFGRYTKPRQPQKPDLPNNFLSADCSNLGLVLNKIRKHGEAKEALLENLRELYPSIKDFGVDIEPGSVQVYVQENGYSIPATRLSDGTLRYLCLLCILCHPTPPPLVCIEEPELGLHPDILVTIGKLLKSTSTRTQLVVTTHSEILVDCLSDSPSDVIVCEKLGSETEIRRLDHEDLETWIQEYSLGQLWRRGDLGGNRW